MRAISFLYAMLTWWYTTEHCSLRVRWNAAISALYMDSISDILLGKNITHTIIYVNDRIDNMDDKYFRCSASSVHIETITSQDRSPKYSLNLSPFCLNMSACGHFIDCNWVYSLYVLDMIVLICKQINKKTKNWLQKMFIRVHFIRLLIHWWMHTITINAVRMHWYQQKYNRLTKILLSMNNVRWSYESLI